VELRKEVVELKRVSVIAWREKNRFRIEKAPPAGGLRDGVFSDLARQHIVVQSIVLIIADVGAADNG
jgi:hypothetical protein